MKFNFLIAEEIRPEATGKFTILGLFPDSIIIVPPQENGNAAGRTPQQIERLAILITASDIPISEHKHTIKGIITPPNGDQNVIKFDLGQKVFEKGKSHNFIVQLKPFTIQGLGKYEVSLVIDNQAHNFQFSILDKIS